MTATDRGLHQDYWTSLARGDRRGAVRHVLSQLDEGRPAPDLLGDVCAAQEQVGLHWQRGEWSVAQEHAATSVNEDVVSAVGVRTEREPDRGLAVVTCPEGEWHALPARVLAECLRLAGWRCHYLGASLPADQVAALVEDLGPDVVALSCSMSSTIPSLRASVAAVREVGAPVLVGGRGTGPQGLWALRLGASAWAPDPAAALALLDREDWPQYVGAAPPLWLPDDDADVLLAEVEPLADQAMLRLRRTFPPMTLYSRRQLRSTEQDLRHVVRFLAAALLVNDAAVLREFLGWLLDVLLVRDVPGRGLLLGLEALEVPGVRASRFLQEGHTYVAGRV